MIDLEEVTSYYDVLGKDNWRTNSSEKRKKRAGGRGKEEGRWRRRNESLMLKKDTSLDQRACQMTYGIYILKFTSRSHVNILNAQDNKEKLKLFKLGWG